MASNVIYIHQLPFQPRRELCRILDADRRWEELGGIYMEYDVTTLTLIGQALLRDKSPTWELLNKYSEQNGTIKRLFVMLARMDHQRAMSVLKPYVEDKYHQLLRSEGIMSTTIISKKADYSRLISQISPSSAWNSSAISPVQNQLSGAAGPSHKYKENVSNSSKLNNIVNLNEEYSQQPSNCAYAMNLASQPDCLPDIMQIPYEDIRMATNDFSKGRILGKGGFGTVYRGEWKGTFVAIKRLTPRHSSGDSAQQLISIKQSLNELNILKTCRFDHILPLYAVSLDGENPCLIYQLMVNGSLEDRLLLKNNTPPLTWSQRSHIAECTTKGLNYLHTTPGKPLVHGDIKSANILLDANMDAKIGDFGLTREGPGCQDTHVEVSSIHGTECYLPLEYLRHKHLSPQVDIYCYGIVLLEIATGLRPFDPKRGKGKRLADHVRHCTDCGRIESLRDQKAGEENLIWFQELIRMGQICSSVDKKKRPPMSQILKQFETIKKEMSLIDKIRRLSSGKGSIPLPPNLTPIELQWYYDLQNAQSGTSVNNRSSAPPGCSRDPGMSLGAANTPEPHKEVITPPAKSNVQSSENLSSEESSEDDNHSVHHVVNPLPETQESSTNDKASADGKAPYLYSLYYVFKYLNLMGHLNHRVFNFLLLAPIVSLLIINSSIC
ncbi:hypothetical protein CEXT_359821 [Caerostris extrusa]|uniref:non-specific serine/threonine protein kinase n=1 Tax=Caerostris extrusa TaxID=172846 RepID=A0AAV4SD69_CAEEX|nr:hypothetical protein CEXT_359821 [Caerostris extrusa]